MEVFGQKVEADMKTKNSLVNNIRKRQKAGTARPKSKTTVSLKAYKAMKKGWPKSK
jgi:hypothetical protein